METLNSIVGAVNAVVWGPLMLVLILGVGLFLQVGLKLMPILRIGTGFSLLFKGRSPEDGEGQITPFNALMTALSATIGTGLARQISGIAAVASSVGQDTRTISAPASAAARICASVASASSVGVFVMVCTAMGASPPTGTLPTKIWREVRRSICRHGRIACMRVTFACPLYMAVDCDNVKTELGRISGLAIS